MLKMLKQATTNYLEGCITEQEYRNGLVIILASNDFKSEEIAVIADCLEHIETEE